MYSLTMYAYKGEAFISKQKNGYKILNQMVVTPWNSCTVMYMYDKNLLPFSHVQTLQHLKLKLSVVQQQQQQR